MKARAQVCVVLTNYNGSQNRVLETCLGTLTETLKNTNADISLIIVDDCSQDDSLEVINKFALGGLNQLQVLNLKEPPFLSSCNLDVTASLNFGIRYVFREHAGCEYVVTLDNDIALSANFLQEMVQRAQCSDGRTGMFASNQYLLDDYPEKRRHRSTGHYMKRAGATLDIDFLDESKHQGKKILCPCFSGALFKTAMLRDVGLVPEHYRHYNNCSEIGFRAHLKGWNVEFVESAVMWHKQPNEISPEKRRDIEISRLWNILRFFPSDRIDEALGLYESEHDRHSLIQEAKDACPTVPCFGDKTKLYEDFVSING